MAGEEREKNVFDSWKYQHYFRFVSMKGEKNIHVYCKLCPGSEMLSTAKNSGSNLCKHLSKIHPNKKLVGEKPGGRLPVWLTTL